MNREPVDQPPASLPLQGIRVVELARLLPGPWACSVLADFGADVVKVEQPGRGDYSRHATPRYVDESVYFTSVNRGKRSLTLDLGTSNGRKVMTRLVEVSDVLVESFRPGVADRLGVGYEAVSEINPRMVYCSISGFGQTGPYSQSAGHDLNIAGMSGLLLPAPERVPTPDGFQMADFAAGSSAITGILLALMRRNQTGYGQYIDIAMLDSILSWSVITGASAFASAAGHADQPGMAVFGSSPRYNTYRCKDGRFVSVSLLETHFWEKFALFVGRPDLINPDESEADRLSDHGELGPLYRRELEGIFATRSRDAWVADLAAADIPCWPINSPEEALSDPQVQARDMIRWFADPHEGSVPHWASPIRSESMQPNLAAAPRLGEHNKEILDELGLDGLEL